MSTSPLLRMPERDVEYEQEQRHPISSARRQLFRFFSSKTFHFLILALVSLDVACLFADIIINLLTCGHRNPSADIALQALEYVSLVFSSLFMLELLASIWAFGISYFHSKFHIFDATIIIISFIFELSLQGVTEEVVSLIVILRLMRVVKIIDEISVGAEEQMSELKGRLAECEKENVELRAKIQRITETIG